MLQHWLKDKVIKEKEEEFIILHYILKCVIYPDFLKNVR